MTEDIEARTDKLRNDAAISCTLLIGDSWPVWDLLKRDPGYFRRLAGAQFAGLPNDRAAEPATQSFKYYGEQMTDKLLIAIPCIVAAALAVALVVWMQAPISGAIAIGILCALIVPKLVSWKGH